MRRLRDIESGRTRRRIGRRVSGTRYVFGNRTRVDSNGVVTERLYSVGALSSVAAEYNASGEVTRRNLLLGGVVVGETTATGSRYFHGDVLGSVRLVTDAGGVVVASADYGAYGAVRRTSGSMPAFGYVGMYGVERDAATGLLFMRARYYSPMLGRFISRDPIGLSGGDVNWYRYCANAPLLFVDPSGKSFLRSIWCDYLRYIFPKRVDDILGSKGTAKIGFTGTLGGIFGVEGGMGVVFANAGEGWHFEGCYNSYGGGCYLGLTAGVSVDCSINTHNRTMYDEAGLVGEVGVAAGRFGVSVAEPMKDSEPSTSDDLIYGASFGPSVGGGMKFFITNTNVWKW